jgi:hypothetical protein
MAHSVSVKSIAAAFAVLLASALAAAAPNAPLVVDSNSHVVVMEYEAWFGPKAVTFQGSSAMPLLAVGRICKRWAAAMTAPIRPSSNSTSPGWNTWESTRPSLT